MSRRGPTTIPTISFVKTSQRTSEDPVFRLLEDKRSRGNYFLADIGVQGILLTLAIVLPLYMTGSLNVQRYLVTPLIAPPVPHEIVEMPDYKPEPLRIKPVPTAAPVEPVAGGTEVEKPKKIRVPEVRFDPKPVPIQPAAPKFEVLAPPAPAPAPAPVVKTDVFSESAAAK